MVFFCSGTANSWWRPSACGRLHQLKAWGAFRLFKLVVAGSRSFADFDRLSADLDYLLSQKSPDDVEIVSGGAAGADALAERYARSRGLAFRAFPADWRRWGKLAGPIRNRQMADYGSAVVVYWDGRSRGSADMISSASAAGLRVVVRRV